MNLHIISVRKFKFKRKVFYKKLANRQTKLVYNIDLDNNEKILCTFI